MRMPSELEVDTIVLSSHISYVVVMRMQGRVSAPKGTGTWCTGGKRIGGRKKGKIVLENSIHQSSRLVNRVRMPT
jgi:hypothetical protein